MPSPLQRQWIVGVLRLMDGPVRDVDQQRLPSKRVRLAVTHTAAGGVVELWQDLANALRFQGHEVELLALFPKNDAGDDAPLLENWNYMEKARRWAPLKFFGACFQLVAYLHRQRPDVVITAMPLCSVLVPVAALFSSKTRVIVTHHSPAFTYARPLRMLGRLAGALKNVTAIVGVSRSVTATFMRYGRCYTRKLKTIRNALPQDVEYELKKMRANRAQMVPEKTVVSIGRLSAQKNYVTLISAMLFAPEASLSIIGEGEDRAMLEQLVAELGLGDRVTFHGHMPRFEALSVAACCTVFAQPSLFEGRSLALLEAAALGMPIVVSDVPTQVEAVTTSRGVICGKVAAATDPIELGQAIRTILDDEREYEYWRIAAAQISRDCSMDEMVRGYLDLMAGE